MIISKVEISVNSAGFRVDGSVRVGSEERNLFYEVAEGADPPSPEMAVATCLAAALPVACWVGEDIEVHEPCDKEFLNRSRLIARAYKRLHGLEKNINIKGPTSNTQPRQGRQATCSLSGGVDSMFSLYRNTGPDAIQPISSVTTIFGVDVPYQDLDSHAKISANLRQFSSAKSLEHFFVRTSYRSVFDDLAPWGRITHGACVAATGFLLSQRVHTYLLPSSSVIDRVYPWGSHPMIDNSFVSSHTRVVNDNWEFYRNEKIAAISEDPLVLRHLKVCNKNDRVSNCCKCEKCLRTMAMLWVLGKLDAADSFPYKLSLPQLRQHRITNKKEIYRFEQLLVEAETRGRTDIAAAVRLVLKRGRLRLLRRDAIRSLGLHR